MWGYNIIPEQSYRVCSIEFWAKHDENMEEKERKHTFEQASLNPPHIQDVESDSRVNT